MCMLVPLSRHCAAFTTLLQALMIFLALHQLGLMSVLSRSLKPLSRMSRDLPSDCINVNKVLTSIFLLLLGRLSLILLLERFLRRTLPGHERRDQDEHLRLLFFPLDGALLLERLESELDESQKREMFFYSHFNLVEETKQDMHSFIDGLIEENKTQNNQFVPFEKIEGGFAQVIPNPLVPDGFITFQLISPQLNVFSAKAAEQMEFESMETLPSSR